jgi:hypothetical protein
MLHVGRIIALIFGILTFLGGLAYVALTIFAYENCNAALSGFGSYCNGALGWLLIGPIYVFLIGVMYILIYIKLKDIEGMMDRRQYEQAKSSALIWMILGFIFGIIVGIFVLIAYLKFDALISWQRSGFPGPSQSMYPPAYGQPAPATPYAQPAAAPAYSPPVMAPTPTPAPATPPMAAPPMPAAAPPPPAVPNCARCGRPTTYIAQYGRYYCYSCQQYV